MNDIGFVYEWIDISNGKKYIGSHKGTPDDGYTGSGIAFTRAYKKRPNDFVRTILYSGTDYRNVEEKILLELDAANNENYYNLKNSSIGWDNQQAVKWGKIQGKINGKKNVESGHFASLKTKEHQIKAGKAGGRKNVESGHLKSISKLGAEAARLVTSKAVLVYKKDTMEFVGEYSSYSEAARILNCFHQGIYSVIKGKQKTHNGYIFTLK